MKKSNENHLVYKYIKCDIEPILYNTKKNSQLFCKVDLNKGSLYDVSLILSTKHK